MPVQNLSEVCDVTLVDPDRVERVQSRLTDDVTSHRLAETFGALADVTRLRIIEALAQEELCVCDISAALRLSQSATSHQLRTLRNLRLVKYRRVGRLVYYSLDDAHISRLFAQGLEHVREDQGASASEAASLPLRARMQ
jgi:DNA-binding transcriptional ArsR family regulator